MTASLGSSPGLRERRVWFHISDPAPDRPRAVDYRRLLGAAAWGRLPAATRARFGEHPDEVIYAGCMHRVVLRGPGRLLALACRFLGEPLVAGTGSRVPSHVRVFVDGRGGSVWERAYHFPFRATRTVRSVKRLDRDGCLLECLGLGLTMRLAVSEHEGALVFRSTGYFWRLPGIRLPLPARWFPGETTVVHRDEGGGRFRFSLRIVHPWFGSIVDQEGVFHAEEVLS